MNIPEPDWAAPDAADEALSARIGVLLERRDRLAELETKAAVQEAVARMAHDLRNPLSTIQALCDGVILEAEDPQLCERVRLVVKQVGKLAGVVTAAVAQVNGRPEAMVPVDVSVLARGLAELVQLQLGSRIRLLHETEADLVCWLPECGLARSLFQLLRNAAAAAGEGGGGWVRLRCTRGEREVRIEVADNGPGLPVELLRQGPNRSDAAVGLAGVERFARAVGGRLELGGSPAGGLVCLVLPVDGRDTRCLEG